MAVITSKWKMMERMSPPPQLPLLTTQGRNASRTPSESPWRFARCAAKASQRTLTRPTLTPTFWVMSRRFVRSVTTWSRRWTTTASSSMSISTWTRTRNSKNKGSKTKLYKQLLWRLSPTPDSLYAQCNNVFFVFFWICIDVHLIQYVSLCKLFVGFCLIS